MQEALIEAVLIRSPQDARNNGKVQSKMLVLLHKKMVIRIFATVMGPLIASNTALIPGWNCAKGTSWH